MGITGLLPFVKKASRPCFLSEFSGQVAAVDTYCWLHKGAFSCAEKLVRGEETDGYVVYVMKMVRLLLSHKIKPVMVFDGCNLPSKAGTEAKRRESRAKNRALAKEMLREGRVREARECFQRCVDVTSHMARAVMRACRDVNVDVIVAPYEADAQLAYLALEGFADLVITEDSDLLLFGCEKVMFKMDSHGGGVLVEQQKLHLALGIPPDKFSLELFRNVCILSGCDYLPSLPGIGLTKASKFFSLTSNTDVYNVLCKLPAYLKMPQLEVTTEYRTNFIQAVNTFLYQLVFCPRDRVLRPLVQYRDGSDSSDHPYAGAHVGHEKALAIALGNIDLQSGKVVGNFDPDRHKGKPMKSSSWCKAGDIVADYLSIWDPNYDKSKVHARNGLKSTADASNENKLSAFGVNETKKRIRSDKTDESSAKKSPSKPPVKKVKLLDMETLFTKRKTEDVKAEESVSTKQTNALLALYGRQRKSPMKLRTSKSDISLQSDQCSDVSSNTSEDLPLRQESVFNPFAKKAVKNGPQSTSVVSNRECNPFRKVSLDACQPQTPLDTHESKASINACVSAQEVSSEEMSDVASCDEKPTTDNIPVDETSPEKESNSSSVVQDSTQVTSGRKSCAFLLQNSSQNGSASLSVSEVLADQQNNNNIQGTTSASNKQRTKIIVKSRYFRPPESAASAHAFGKPPKVCSTELSSSCEETTASSSRTNESCVNNVDAVSSELDVRPSPENEESCEPRELAVSVENNVSKSGTFTESQPEVDSIKCIEFSQNGEGESRESDERADNVEKSQDPKESVRLNRFNSANKTTLHLSKRNSEATTCSQESTSYNCSMDSESFGFTPMSGAALELSQGSNINQRSSSQCLDDVHAFESQPETSSRDVCECLKTKSSLQECEESVKVKSIYGDENKNLTTIDADYNVRDSREASGALSGSLFSAFRPHTESRVGLRHSISPVESPKIFGRQTPTVSGVEAPSFGSETPVASSMETPTLSGRETPTASGRETPTLSGPETPTLSGPETPTLSGRETPTLSGRETPTASGRETPTALGVETPTIHARDSQLSFDEASLSTSPSESPRPLAGRKRLQSSKCDLPESPLPSCPTSPVFLRSIRSAKPASKVLVPIENTAVSSFTPRVSGTQSSPYFSGSGSASKLSSCRKVGLSRPSKGKTSGAKNQKFRQLDLREMFAGKR